MILDADGNQLIITKHLQKECGLENFRMCRMLFIIYMY